MPPNEVEKIVQEAARRRKNRVEYFGSFNVTNLNSSGLVQCESKSKYDRVSLGRDQNDAVRLFGFHPDSSRFELNFSVFSLLQAGAQREKQPDFRLAKVKFYYHHKPSDSEYVYESEQLLDYGQRRLQADKHEVKNIYKVGSMSLETVLPFSLSRILFNGLLRKRNKTSGDEQLVSVRIAISTHPTCDKFDYQYRFDKSYTAKIISGELANENPAEAAKTKRHAGELMSLILENRIDQCMMYQGSLEELGTGGNGACKFIMWGGKIKKFLQLAPEGEQQQVGGDEPREGLEIWAEGGQQINLNRLVNRRHILYGMIHNDFDYASHLYEARLETESGVKMSDLKLLSELPDARHKIVLVGFKEKKFVVEFEAKLEANLFSVKVNGFAGFCNYRGPETNMASEFHTSQSVLWSLNLNQQQLPAGFANEQLLGGKGISLVELNRLVSIGAFRAPDESLLAGVSVPRGLVVTSCAYKVWLSSDSRIPEAIEELDRIRRALAARSIYTNPMSSRHVSLLEAQRILRAKCEETAKVLKACPLPPSLKGHLYVQLRRIFSEQELEGKLFAVRSSAVGEDSLETSAAGQMKTFLDTSGFEAICRATVDCWASQFALEAVEYKSHNGLEFNLPMAVVVQELVNCRASGVASTCQTLSGNMKSLDITANLGLGEGVVSGKETDTFKVSLEHLKWSASSGEPLEFLSAARDQSEYVEKSSDTSSCCLTNEQIVSLSNLLLKLRAQSAIKQREVEWGLTEVAPADRKESSSSSSSDESTSRKVKFHIHLLQSRPLTHLNRLSSSEISHELDYGLSSGMDVVSRANLGEVMPGGSSPMNISYYMTICSSCVKQKPFERWHTSKTFTANAFCFYAQMATMVFTSMDTIARFMNRSKDDANDMVIKTMIGTGDDDNNMFDTQKLDLLKSERINPLSNVESTNFLNIVLMDSGGLRALEMWEKLFKQKDSFLAGLLPISQLIENTETGNSPTNLLESKVRGQIRKLFGRLSEELELLKMGWIYHIRCTIQSMSYNVMCMKILSQSSKYPNSVDSTEILHDFSVLMRGGEKTESGDVSKTLDGIIQAMLEDKQIERAKGMSTKELYEYLTQDVGSNKCAKLYKRFMLKNGHRAYREFDFGTKVWEDDPSYIVKSLAARLRQFREGELDEKRRLEEEKSREQQVKMAEIMAKIDKARFLLTRYALPRARHYVARRERSKSRLMKVIHIYRLAFRHLAGLLCLVGCLPEVDLIYHLTIEELASVVEASLGEQPRDLSRILYKARRRRQRVKLLERVTFPQPTMHFHQILDIFAPILDDDHRPGKPPAADSNEVSQDEKDLVRGMTSCAGCVTGRACVVNSLDDMDSVEQGDVLITYSIDISWSVYFFALAGIVTEVGGLISHGAVLAREYGIPTLCTAVGACSKFETGQMVTLDANKGVCYLAKEASDGAVLSA